jgi:arylformamidase
MRTLIDLSGPLENGLWGYHELPGLEKVLPRFHVETATTIEKHAFFSSLVSSTTVSGLYLESQAHIIDGGRTLDQYSADRFILPAKIVKLPPQTPKALIDADLLARHAPRIEKGEALLVATGWGAMWNKPGYVLRCPNMARSALQWVLDHEISLFGVDIPCIEASWSDDDTSEMRRVRRREEKGSLLRTLFERDILLLAPLVKLVDIASERGTLICLPLKLKGTSGAPCRAVFAEGE